MSDVRHVPIKPARDRDNIESISREARNLIRT